MITIYLLSKFHGEIIDHYLFYTEYRPGRLKELMNKGKTYSICGILCNYGNNSLEILWSVM
jgi:hypothetical protein